MPERGARLLGATRDGKAARSQRSVERALRWIADHTTGDPGLQVSSRDPRPYPEVTGYVVPTLLRYGEGERALRFARWLLSIQNGDGSWSDAAQTAAYTFDTAQVLRGLLAVRGELAASEGAIRRGCEWLLTQIEPSGRMVTPSTAEWRLPGGRAVPDSIHLHCLEPLREAGRALGEWQYLQAADRVLAHYRAQPDLAGFSTLAHFHAYIIEALVDLGEADLARQGMAEPERLQRADGWVPTYREVSWVCSTAVAQYAAIWYKLGDRDRGDRALTYLERRQSRSGGFLGNWGRGASYFPREEISWAVKFFLDAQWWRGRAV